jgi:hypothetical protein
VGKSRLYPVIIGEHGTGKISLIKLAVNSMDEPKGVAYADMDDTETDAAQVMREALGWTPDPLLDSDKRNCCSSLLVLRLIDSQLHLCTMFYEFIPISPSSISKSMGECRS